VFPIDLPALRERQEDIDLLADTLLTRLAPGRAYTLAASTRSRLRAYDFPGNIRELRNILERAMLMADGDTLLPDHLPRDVAGRDSADLPAAMDGVVSLEVAERRYLMWALGRLGGDRKALARQLGISERTLYRKLA
jgi:DNA-binding NtrC family response regulator